MTDEPQTDEIDETVEDIAPQAANDAGDETPIEDVPPSELELAQAEVVELKDKLLRAMAELENVRRRAERDKADAKKFAVSDFARDLLTIPDNLRRAIDAISTEGSEDGSELAAFIEGVVLTERELLSVLERHGVKQVNPDGQKLDPNLHQAMVQVDHPEAPAGTVMDVLQIGYVLHDRLLRAAMVAVAKGPGSSEGETPEAGKSVDTKA